MDPSNIRVTHTRPDSTEAIIIESIVGCETDDSDVAKAMLLTTVEILTACFSSQVHEWLRSGPLVTAHIARRENWIAL